MGFLGDVLLGAAVVVVPSRGLPLLGLTAAVQGVRAVSHQATLYGKSSCVLSQSSSGSIFVWHPDHSGRRKADRDPSMKVLTEIPPARLTWESVNCSIAASKKDKKAGNDHPKSLLNDIKGTASPGRLLALMGPSGSGKTTLLNALAGHVPVTKGMSLSGVVRINGKPVADSGVRVGYVQQEDVFYSQMTVQETLDMAAVLRLSQHTPADQRAAVVEDVMKRLDLTRVAHTIVGDKKTRGLSGGEKKRLAIAVELISKPSLLFLDEPTTGLDAFQALQVMEALKQLALDGHTIITAIHQPRSAIYELFDDLVLLSRGRAVYASTADGALQHMAKQGHECPEHYNPAEFLADLISVDTRSEEASRESQERVDKLVAREREQASHIDHDTVPDGAPSESARRASAGHPHKPPLRVQLRQLLKRSWKQVTRDKAAIKLRVGTNIQSGIVFGCIWWRLRLLQRSISSRLGLLQVVAVYLSQGALFKTLNLFPPEKNLVGTERAKGLYDVLPYFLSKTIAELPVVTLFPFVFSAIVYPMTGLQRSFDKFATFAGSNILETYSSTFMGMAIGAVAPSTEAALVLGPAISLVFVVFGGLYTNQTDVPKVLRWVPNASAIKQGYDTLCKNEFKGLEFEREGPSSITSGAAVLKRQGFQGTVRDSLLMQGRVLAFTWWLTYCILKAKSPTFQTMVDVSKSSDDENGDNDDGLKYSG